MNIDLSFFLHYKILPTVDQGKIYGHIHTHYPYSHNSTQSCRKGTGKSYACYLSIEAEHGKQQVCWTLTIGTLMKFQDLPFSISCFYGT
jgi:hypothetical protein